ncbi:50S ribosomal protein L33 [Candidatus Wolfebacteria bacterium CG02_land_8_20_14_3_00_37_12]|jgi:large subunit ribosomal protein L33|uniref:Large ribosomal subunit protein bL33 n=1 Tax=Candidatus Wolfebacteria bacterium CG02_land_8_20_14_3_00_37_12 TaxID=1975066 RepID=A0A2M7CQQ2_9BACT|nr:MAG: 50S ribosomal protein L33 [Candidatus Wolfebacteria bacterium CG02_land_8_20_14_3_00_37_12]
MAKSKFSENLIKLKCAACKRVNYYTRKNKKKIEKKLELKKFCSWCRKSTAHKEAKR